MTSNKRIRYIYCVTNLVNTKTYIGRRTLPKGVTLEEDTYLGSGLWLKAAIKKYNKESFTKEILIVGEMTSREINECECYYISNYRLGGKAEYNIADGGQGGDLYIRSEEWRKRKSEEAKHRYRNKENHPRFGATLSDETKAKIGRANSGRKPSAETREKLSKSHRKFNSIETRQKISAILSDGRMAGEKSSSFGRYWWTDGITNVKSVECPPGLHRGRTILKLPSLDS